MHCSSDDMNASGPSKWIFPFFTPSIWALFVSHYMTSLPLVYWASWVRKSSSSPTQAERLVLWNHPHAHTLVVLVKSHLLYSSTVSRQVKRRKSQSSSIWIMWQCDDGFDSWLISQPSTLLKSSFIPLLCTIDRQLTHTTVSPEAPSHACSLVPIW